LWLAVFITLTVLEPVFATQAYAPFGVMATPSGLRPTPTVAVTFWVTVLMMLIVPFPPLVT
jgi:hypothetical protein